MNKELPLEVAYFSCACLCPTHVLQIVYDPEEHEVYMSIIFSYTPSIWKRIWIGLKYIFNKAPPRYGMYDCWMCSDVRELTKMKDLIDKAVSDLERRPD